MEKVGYTYCNIQIKYMGHAQQDILHGRRNANWLFSILPQMKCLIYTAPNEPKVEEFVFFCLLQIATIPKPQCVLYWWWALGTTQPAGVVEKPNRTVNQQKKVCWYCIITGGDNVLFVGLAWHEGGCPRSLETSVIPNRVAIWAERLVS